MVTTGSTGPRTTSASRPRWRVTSPRSSRPQPSGRIIGCSTSVAALASPPARRRLRRAQGTRWVSTFPHQMIDVARRLAVRGRAAEHRFRTRRRPGPPLRNRDVRPRHQPHRSNVLRPPGPCLRQPAAQPDTGGSAGSPDLAVAGPSGMGQRLRPSAHRPHSASTSNRPARSFLPQRSRSSAGAASHDRIQQRRTHSCHRNNDIRTNGRGGTRLPPGHSRLDARRTRPADDARSRSPRFAPPLKPTKPPTGSASDPPRG